MKNPEVSFVIRTKNEGKFIGKVLDFLQKQTFKDFEIIIVDSGSTDKTLEIVRKFPITLVKIKPSDFNFSYALNLGISKAKGKYIAIISGHSIPITDTWLKDGVAVLKEENVAGVSGTFSEFMAGYFNRGIERLALFFHKNRIDYSPWLTNTNALIKKSLWQKYHFDESLSGCEDYDWGKEMISRGYNVVKYKPFSVFHSHILLGRPGYFRSLSKWRKWNEIVDKKKRPSSNR